MACNACLSPKYISSKYSFRFKKTTFRFKSNNCSKTKTTAFNSFKIN